MAVEVADKKHFPDIFLAKLKKITKNFRQVIR
jgi:hypothetical protein